MTEYFVRKTGNDGNAGTSAGAAWLTLDKVFDSGSGVTGGDIVWIGAGIYREALAAAAVNLTNPTSLVRIVGDIDGAKTGDAGPVIWTNWLTNDTTASSGNVCFNGNSKDYLSIERIAFISGAGGSAGNISAIGNHWRITECYFEVAAAGGVCLTTTTAQATAKDLIVDRCIGVATAGGSSSVFLAMTHTQNATAEYDSDVTIRNSSFYGFGLGVLSASNTGSSTFKGGGGRLLSSLIVNCNDAISGQGSGVSGQYPMQLLNCRLLDTSSGSEISTVGSYVAEDNYLYSTSAVTLTQGLFSKSQSSPRAHYTDFGQLGLWGLGGAVPHGPLPYSYAPLAILPNAPQGLAIGRGGTGTEDATVGTVAWTTPGNADLYNDGNNAVSGSIVQNAITRYIMLVNNVAVPSGATVKGIRVQVLATASNASSVRMSSVKLVQAGTISGNDLASSETTQFSSSATHLTYGSASDPLWGLTLADTDVNDAGFGCVVAFINVNASARTITVNGVRLVVSYELAGQYYDLTVDLLNRPRPSGMQQLTPQVGHLERHDFGTKETSTTHGGAAALKLTGPGDQQFDIPVDAVATTITVYARYDSTHAATTKPQAILLDSPDIGVTTSTATMTAAADTWEQLTLGPFTPTAKGIVTIRLRSRSAGAAGIAFFDDVAVTV